MGALAKGGKLMAQNGKFINVNVYIIVRITNDFGFVVGEYW